MSVTGIYYIPCNPDAHETAVRTIVHRLRTTYQPTKLGRWALEYKLLRDTPSCLPASNFAPGRQPQPRYMHFLSLGHYQSHGFINISNRPEVDPLDPSAPSSQGTLPSASTTTGNQISPAGTSQHQSATRKDQHGPASKDPHMTMITLDPVSFGSFFSMTLRTCAPMWAPRHTVTVTSDDVYEVADFRIRVGEVRQIQPKYRVRGAIVEIEYHGPGNPLKPYPPSTSPDEQSTFNGAGDFAPTPAPSTSTRNQEFASEEDWEVGESLIRGFWNNISVPGAKEAIRVPGVGTETQEIARTGLTPDEIPGMNSQIAGVDLARQYMEVLKFYR